jgi:L-amino acid ligase
MHEALRAAGLSSLYQTRVRDVAGASAWVSAYNRWPVVVKPVDSAGADGVRFCRDLDEVALACDDGVRFCRDLDEVALACANIFGKTNRLGTRNDAAVIQERILGQQYIVNAVSLGGRHYIAEIWRDDKIPVEGAALVCDREVLLGSDAPEASVLTDYVCKALDALGIAEGPSHSELFLTPQGTPVLVESAARMQGTIDDQAVIEATGHSHVTLTALRYAQPNVFRALLGRRYERRSHLHCVSLRATTGGLIVKNRCPELIGALPSFRSLLHTPSEGDRISRTTDLFSNPGIAYLANASETTLLDDYQTIRTWEREGRLFELA